MEKALSKEQYDRIFADGVKSVLGEKTAGVLKDIGSGVIETGKFVAGIPKDLLLYGALTGAAVGASGHVLTDQLTQDSPEEELNRTLEAMYSAKRKELADAKWMNRVRAMRADLMANRKKMTAEEYTAKYNALVDALNERKA